MPKATLAACLLALIASDPITATRPSEPAATIAIRAAAEGDWSATYALARPARALVFARSPDSSRTRTWSVPPVFELVAVDGGERVRRRDGAAFSAVTVSMPPTYRHLPNDYAPFSPFGDGGMLVHSGRFFACADICSDDPTFRFSLRAPAGRHVIVAGRRHAGAASWRDGGDGTNVYVGAARPIETPAALAVIDRTLPPPIRQRLDADLPRFMRFFAARLGALAQRPALFVSYDLSHRGGWGRQGGVLPGQVFVHFYGPTWTTRMTEPGFDFDLAWHLAHEAGHLYQRQVTVADEDGAWVHEGGAEAFAAIALRSLDPAAGAQIDAKVAAARSACAAATATRSLSAALVAGDADAAYQCGLVVGLALHRATLAAAPRSEGLFTIWRRLLDRERPGASIELPAFTQAVTDVAGTCAARAVERVAGAPLAAANDLGACDARTAPDEHGA